MKTFITENLREIAGWIAIASLFLVFSWGKAGFFGDSYGRVTFETFEAMTVLTIFILAWLKVGKK